MPVIKWCGIYIWHYCMCMFGKNCMGFHVSVAFDYRHLDGICLRLGCDLYCCAFIIHVVHFPMFMMGTLAPWHYFNDNDVDIFNVYRYVMSLGDCGVLSTDNETQWCAKWSDYGNPVKHCFGWFCCNTLQWRHSGANQRKHQSSSSLAFVRGMHRWPVNSPHKGPVPRKMFPFDDVIMNKWPNAQLHLYRINLKAKKTQCNWNMSYAITNHRLRYTMHIQEHRNYSGGSFGLEFGIRFPI